MNNADKFLNAFALIEKECYRILNDAGYMRFYQLIKEASKRSSIVKKHEMTLQQYGDLRNAIVHQRTDGGEIVAIPVDWVVLDIERIAKLLVEPPLVVDYFTKKVRSCRFSDTILDVYQKMKELDTSKFPISEDGKFAGLLTLEMIVDALVLKDKPSIDILVEEVYKPQYKKDKVIFLSKKASLMDVNEAFEKALCRGVNLIAILVTKTGSKEEKIEGIITIADLPYVLELIG